jgi:hypothetical protein
MTNEEAKIKALEHHNKMKAKKMELYKKSTFCENCGVTMNLNEMVNNETATIQHNSYRGSDTYHDDISLFCYGCNQEESVERSKLHTNLFLSNRAMLKLYSLGLNKQKINILSKPSCKGTFDIKGIKIHVCNGSIKEIKNNIYIKFKYLKKYLYHRIEGKISNFNSFDEYFNFKLNEKYTNLKKQVN